MPVAIAPRRPRPKMITVNRDTLRASLCRESFFDFFLNFWDTVSSEELVCNWHIEYLCNEAQILCERVFRRQPKEYDLIVNVSPGESKSTIFSEMLPVWCWTRDPSIRTICASHGFRLSLDLADKCLRIASSEKFRRLFPEIELKSDAVGMFSNTLGGQRISTSTGTNSILGMHAHLQVVDDPIDPEAVLSDVQNAQANRWMDRTLPSRMVNKKMTPMILVMQRLGEDDPTAHRLAKAEGGTPVRHICMPAELSPDVRPRALKNKYVDGLFDPVRLPQEVLTQAEHDLQDVGYAGQYMQNPIPEEGGMFKTDMLLPVNAAPKLLRVVRYWDKAGTRAGGAWTIGFLMGMAVDQKLYILDVVRGQWEAGERERMIKNTAKRDGFGVLIGIEQEPGSGGKESAQATVTNLKGYRVRVDKPSGSNSSKEARADSFATQLNIGNVRMVKAEWNAALLNEFQFFPNSKYKDQVDAGSGAFNILVGIRHVGAF